MRFFPAPLANPNSKSSRRRFRSASLCLPDDVRYNKPSRSGLTISKVLLGGGGGFHEPFEDETREEGEGGGENEEIYNYHDNIDSR